MYIHHISHPLRRSSFLKGFVLFSLLILTLCTSAQKSNKERLDSLHTALKITRSDTAYLRTLLQVIEEEKFVDPAKASDYAKEAEALATRLEDESSLALVNFLFGYIAYVKGDFSEAAAYYDKSDKLYRKLNDREGIARIRYHSGVVHVFKGDYIKANNHFFEALKMYEALGKDKWISNCIIAIGNVYGRQGNTAKELEYHLKGLQYKIEQKDESGICASYINIGNVYGREKKYAEALDYFKKGLALAEQQQNKKWIVNSTGNIGMLYGELGEYEKALEYMLRSLQLSEELGDKQAITVDLYTIGSTYASLKDYKKAKEYLDRSAALAQEIGSIVDEQNVYEMLSDLYAKKKEYREAYLLHKQSADLKDSIYRTENTKQFAEMGAKYEAEKKDNEIKLLNKDKEMQAGNLKRQKLVIWTVAGGLLLVLALAFFIYRQYRLKNRMNIALETAYHVIEVKNKDITDSINYAKRIQTAMLPSLETIRHFLPQTFILYKPKDIVSGDFYWFHEKNGDRFLAVGDCTGHGVPGAFMSMIGNDLLTQIIIEKGILQPDLILAQLHTGVQHALKQNDTQSSSRDGMDISLVRLRTGTDHVDLAYAGALRPLWLIRKEEEKLEEYKPDKFPIGGAQTADSREFTLHEIRLFSGDAFYMSTDGYADQFGGKDGKKFMTRNLKELLLRIRHLSMEQQQEALEKNLASWKGDRDQIDDVLLAGIRI